ncbi:hypothetical protein SAY87_030455 [Trapa incisa]|uniref:VAN3-binding protein-like auxin canalisation domain-containing protein n=1 Tax=Trapa incisa TaxID=236973 RepID=A0AAN7QLT2_9MYRT|nr:hypothetical protein SAY87_030455 [Trapa incisa]
MYPNEKVQNTFWTRYECMKSVDDNVIESPISFMEYLSRSWSPVASNFLEIFSSNKLLLSLEDTCFSGKYGDGEIEGGDNDQSLFLYNIFDSIEHVGEPTDEEKDKRKPTENIANRMDSLQALFTIDRPYVAAYQPNASFEVSWPKYKHVKGWFRGNPITRLLKWHKHRRKDELRLRTAKLDAALSVARLAAAIAGITGTNIIGMGNLQTNKAMVSCDSSTCNVISFAAALVAVVCAEAAETAGAPRGHIASIINSGFTTQTPGDMVTLTAAAATCLRGAATLRSRTIMAGYFQEEKKLLASCTPLSIIMASGHMKHGLVSIHIKCEKLLLRIVKKYLGAVISCKEYTILDMMEEARKSHGYYLLTLQTDSGDIKILLKNEKQTDMWMSAVSDFLEKHNRGRAGLAVEQLCDMSILSSHV